MADNKLQKQKTAPAPQKKVCCCPQQAKAKSKPEFLIDEEEALIKVASDVRQAAPRLNIDSAGQSQISSVAPLTPLRDAQSEEEPDQSDLILRKKLKT
jgi:hypothetical protein